MSQDQLQMFKNKMLNLLLFYMRSWIRLSKVKARIIPFLNQDNSSFVDNSIDVPHRYSSLDKIDIVQRLKALTVTLFEPHAHVTQTPTMTTHGMVNHSKLRSYASALLASTPDVVEPTNIHTAITDRTHSKGIEALYE